MYIRRSLTAATVVLLLALGAAPAARCEVAAETDAFGRYVRTSVYTQSALRQVKIWRIVRRNMPGVHPLNPTGDRFGDQYPAVAENLRDHRYPVAVWSRYNGLDFDLVWSRFTGTAWTPVQWVGTGFEAGDDVQPFISFDVTGRPYVAWWRDEEGVGTVYVSFFLVTRWSAPIQVSDTGTDSRAPRMVPMAGSNMRVDFRTPSGLESRIVAPARRKVSRAFASIQRPAYFRGDLDSEAAARSVGFY